MSLDPLVTHSYAEALHALVKKRGESAVFAVQAGRLRALVADNHRLRTFLEAPHIPETAKSSLIEDLVRPSFHPILADFCLYLIRKYRIEYLCEILDAFVRLVEEEQGILQAAVSSARELSFTEKVVLKSALEKFMNKQLKIAYHVDPHLLGGIVFRARDLLIDNSLRGALRQLRDCLETAQVH